MAGQRFGLLTRMSETSPNELHPEESSSPLSEPQPDWTRFSSYKEAGPAGVLAILWAILPGVLGITLLVQLGPVADWMEANPNLGLVLYTFAFAATAGLGLLPTYAQAFLGGWVFGLAVGLPAALFGFTLAAAVGYGVAMLVSGERIRRMISKHAQAQAIRDDLVGSGFGRTLLVVSLLRVPPTSPFSLTNLAMAATGVSVLPYLLGTTLGMAPRTVVYVAMGAAGSASGAEDLGELLSDGQGKWMAIAGVVLMLGVFQILQRMAASALDRVRQELPAEDEGSDSASSHADSAV